MKAVKVHILTLASPASAHSEADNEIVVTAKETEAVVEPRLVGTPLINLPPLTFHLRAAIRCTGSPSSVTVSIADTFQTLNLEQLVGQRGAEATLTVPGRQLTLAASQRFCIENDEEAEDEILIPGFATAHASLQCESDAGVTVHYVSTSLSLKLRCALDPVEKDQVPSPDR